jgi:hypothetical protein
MTIKRRVFISSPADRHLDARRVEVKRAIMDEIERLGYEAQAFGTRDVGRGLPKRRPWAAGEVEDVMRRCVGAAILGLARHQLSEGERPVSLASEYCHYEAALARACKLPILSLLEEGVAEEGYFGPKSGVHLIVPADAGESWVQGRDFQDYLDGWRKDLEDRWDIFLAYSSGSLATATKVKQYLNGAGATVLDWREFPATGTIFEEIREAASRCSAGVFLFTKDDLGEGGQAFPRDNVVFEAGYFMSAKGEKRVLIIREQDSKMPADLGGRIYIELADRESVEAASDKIGRFVGEL